MQIETQKIKEKEVLIRNNLILYLAGRFVSQFGTEVFNFAAGLFILKETGSGIAFSISVLVSMLPPAILSTFAGVVADRFDRKKIVVSMDMVSGFIMFGLLLALNFYNRNIYFLYIAMFLLSCVNSFFNIAMNASKANIVDSQNLPRINSLSHSVRSIVTICAPFLGGIVIKLVDIKFFILINGISFVMSAISEFFIKFDLNESKRINSGVNEIKPPTEKNLLQNIKEGYTHLKRSELIYILTIFGVLSDFIMLAGVVVCLPYIINNVLNLAPYQYGIIRASFPLGIFVSSLYLSLKKKHDSSIYKTIIACTFMIGFSVLFIGIISNQNLVKLSEWQYVVGFCLYGLFSSYFTIKMDVPVQVIYQQTIPDHIRGRVMGIQRSISMFFTPIGIVVAGILLDITPAHYLLIITGGVMLGVTFLMSKNTVLKKYAKSVS